MGDLKTCKTCLHSRSIKDFYAFTRRTGVKAGQRGVHSDCKACYLARVKETYDPARRKEYALRTLYGISSEEWQMMYDKQDGECVICLRPGEKLVVDHDHDTGEVRGLLCNNCNRGLGLLGDDAANLNRALQYLRFPLGV